MPDISIYDLVFIQDLDVVMKDGMGMRYAFMGPMETIHLNAEGTQNYCDRYGETIYDVSSDSGPIPTCWKQESEEDKATVAKIHSMMCTTVPETQTKTAIRKKRI